MTTAKKLMTTEEFMALPDDGRRRELLDGEVVELAPVNGDHAQVEALVAHYLLLDVLPSARGVVWTGDPAFIVRHNPDRTRCPDVCLFVAGRIPSREERQHALRVIPDLIVEVISPGDTAAEVQQKTGEWLAAGARLVWNVYPMLQQVVAYRSLSDVRTYAAEDTLDAEPVLPGFACPVAKLFA
ncbi:MAG: Uma2 family endonuclease [Chloroflexi bacterium]|nr:Uma2 family endonuclease [Chloroflexota bacterium]